MTFRICAVGGLLLSLCFAATAQTSTGTTVPTVIHTPVQYPASAVSAREEGVVWVAAEIDATGHVVSVKMDKSSGHPDLDLAALQSLPQWSFLAGTKDGKPAAQWVRVPINFYLNNPPPSAVALPPNSPIAAYEAAIRAQVSAHWDHPKNLPQQPCVIQITQLPGGQIIHTEIQPGCPYDDAQKQSLVNAVVSASPLPYKGFEAFFQRTINFMFTP